MTKKFKTLLLTVGLFVTTTLNQTSAIEIDMNNLEPVASGFSLETLSGGQQVCKMSGKIVSCDKYLGENTINTTWEKEESTQPVTVSTSRCELNGQEIPCAELEAKAKGFLKSGLYIIGGIAIVGILLSIFWIWMLVDAIRFQEKDKALWIILMIFTGFIGSIIYYFAAKRSRKK